MIYVFDIESAESEKDTEYYRDCLDGLRYYSPDAAIFLLLHKMDLVRDPQQVLEKRRLELEEISGDVTISVFGTTIFDQTLYKVRSRPPLTLHTADLD
jgi:Ras-related GTP-binding protein A/B